MLVDWPFTFRWMHVLTKWMACLLSSAKMYTRGSMQLNFVDATGSKSIVAFVFFLTCC